MLIAASERSHLDVASSVLLKWGTLQFLIVVWKSLHTHSTNLCITFVIAGNFDEITTKSGLILFILKPKLRERKETNNL